MRSRRVQNVLVIAAALLLAAGLAIDTVFKEKK